MYGIDIQVSEEHRDSRFSGMIRHERGIDYITKLLTTTSNIECIIENGVIYLKQNPLHINYKTSLENEVRGFVCSNIKNSNKINIH